MDTFTVGLFNDSFPPTIDGVANVVFNYAAVIKEKYGEAVVATPYYPGVVDDYPFEVVRYPSANISRKLEYRVGYPFRRSIIKELTKKKIDIIHTHCPFSATLLARLLRHKTGAPIVLTYHTKFDIDIEKRIAYNPIRKASVRMLLANINACDEVWAVSSGAGENLRQLGYKGDYRIMENGVDFTLGKAPEAHMALLRDKHGLKEEVPTFLYVGRMMWYKGIRLTVDALRIARDQGAVFKMIFVGEGTDRDEILEYVSAAGLEDRCIFTGAIRDRKELKAYFSVANLFLFPSTYDTNGIVVREAAACYCPSLLVEGSCSAEDIVHDHTGILVGENKESISAEILKACGDLNRLERIGAEAAGTIYISWEDAVEKAYNRYQIIIDRFADMPHEWRKEPVPAKKPHILRNRYAKAKDRILKHNRITGQNLKVRVNRFLNWHI